MATGEDREVFSHLSDEQRDTLASYRIVPRTQYGRLYAVPQVKERWLWWDFWFDLSEGEVLVSQAEDTIRLHQALPKRYRLTKVKGHV